ncbi:hypothetical protein LXL04_023725 [Taraxacum kok-saghyz]
MTQQRGSRQQRGVARVGAVEARTASCCCFRQDRRMITGREIQSPELRRRQRTVGARGLPVLRLEICFAVEMQVFQIQMVARLDGTHWRCYGYIALAEEDVLHANHSESGVCVEHPRPGVVENETSKETRKRSNWDNDDYIYRGYILNGMSDSIFDIHGEAKSAKKLWDTLEVKYITDDASNKKFLVSDFNNYKMVDSRTSDGLSFGIPVQKLQPFRYDCANVVNSAVRRPYYEMHISLTLLSLKLKFLQDHLTLLCIRCIECEWVGVGAWPESSRRTLHMSSVIEKLPTNWKYFKHNLKHQKEEMSLVQLASHLCIGESLRAKDNDYSDKTKGNVESGQPSVNMVEDKQKNSNNKGQCKKRKQEHVPHNSNKNKKELVYWRCFKVGH